MPVQKLASGGCDNTVKVWKYTGGNWRLDCFPPLSKHTDWVRDVAWAPNLGLPKCTIASASQDGTVVIWTQVMNPSAVTQFLLWALVSFLLFPPGSLFWFFIAFPEVCFGFFLPLSPAVLRKAGWSSFNSKSVLSTVFRVKKVINGMAWRCMTSRHLCGEWAGLCQGIYLRFQMLTTM
jgi:WD40 repeat protein